MMMMMMKWVSEYAVRTYPTADSVVQRILNLQSGRIDYTVVCFITHDCSRKL